MSAFAYFTTNEFRGSATFWSILISSYLLIGIIMAHILAHLFLHLWVLFSILFGRKQTWGSRFLSFIFIFVFVGYITVLSYVSLAYLTSGILSSSVYKIELSFIKDYQDYIFYGLYGAALIPTYYAVITSIWTWITVAIGVRAGRFVKRIYTGRPTNPSRLSRNLSQILSPELVSSRVNSVKNALGLQADEDQTTAGNGSEESIHGSQNSENSLPVVEKKEGSSIVIGDAVSKINTEGDTSVALKRYQNFPTMPLVQIIMPVYHEPFENLKSAVDSLCKSDYEFNRLHVMLSFDDYEVSNEFVKLVDYLRTGQDQKGRNVIVRDESDYPDICVIEKDGIVFTVARFEHSGKLGTQRKSYEYLQKIYPKGVAPERPLLFFIDSDVILYPDTVWELAMYLEKKPNVREAVTGFVFCRNAWSFNLWQYIQDAEYAEAQLLYRSAESSLGNVTCLPGVCTMIRMDVLESAADEYFYGDTPQNSFEYCQKNLGEDRFLTHILMTSKPNVTGRLGFWLLGKCKTDAPPSFLKLVKQRRRWLLATITNETLMLCTPSLWFNMPLLLIFRFLVSLKFGGLLFYVFLIDFLAKIGTFELWKLIFLLAPLVPAWAMVSLLAITERRFKMMFLFPIFYVLGPLFSFFYTINAVFTLRSKTWGGPRAQKPSS